MAVVPTAGEGAALLDNKGERDLEVLPGSAQHGNAAGDKSENLMAAVGKDVGKKESESQGINEKARSKFRHFCAANGRLTLENAAKYVASVAAECNIPTSKLAKPDAMFWRFDFSGDGELDEQEAVRMASSMVRNILQADTTKKNSSLRHLTGDAPILGKKFRLPDDEFLLGKKLGQGGQGAVYSATEKATRARRVVKFFEKGNINMPVEYIQEEFALLRTLDHPHIQRLYDIFEDRENIYVISEPYEGGDLMNLVPRATEAGVPVTNVYLATVMRQAIQGVAYVHSKQIIHCDLKEPNCMVVGSDLAQPTVVVIDFGLANRFTSAKAAICGTPGYMPPEVWSQRMWTPKGDVFSLGVMLFQMFAGKRCFPCQSMAQCRSMTCTEDPDYSCLRPFAHLEDLVSGMLLKDFRDRPTCLHVLSSKFFLAAEREEDEAVRALPGDVVDAICHLNKKSDTLTALMLDIAQLENLAQLQKLNTLFTTMDANGDGKIDAEELNQALQDLPADKRKKVADALLMDGADSVMYTMFMGQMMHALQADMNRVLMREFRALDKDESGSLTTSEVAALLKRPALAFLHKDADELMQLMDKDKNGNISFAEFAYALGGGDEGHRAAPDRDNGQHITIRSQYTTKSQTTAITQEDLGQTKGVTWSGKFKNIGTTWVMKTMGWNDVLGSLCGLGLCCWWVPLVFLLGAVNVAESCEYALDLWLVVGACLMTVFTPVASCFMVLSAKMRAKALFRIVRVLPMFGNILLAVWFFLGLVWYGGMAERDACVEDENGAVDPIGLMFAWFFCFLPFQCCATCLVCVLNNMLREVALR